MRGHHSLVLLLALVACRADGSNSESNETEETTTEETTTDGDPEGFVTVVSVGTDQGAFSSVWGQSPEDVWAVGGQRDMDGESNALIYRRDAEGWDPFEVPAEMPMLNWVWGTNTGTEVWVVGFEGAIWSWDGDTWVEHQSGTDRVLWGIWGTGADRRWAVGGNAISDEPLMLEWDGSAWSAVDLPALDGNGLLKVWGTSETDVLMVGDKGSAAHYDGNAWIPTDSGSIADLVSLWGTGPTEILAVGGRANGRLARWNGDAWQGETVGLPGLNGVWMDEAGVATIVGNMGTVARLQAGSMEPEQEDSDTLTLLHAVYGFESGLRIAVGGNLIGSPPFHGVIVESGG